MGATDHNLTMRQCEGWHPCMHEPRSGDRYLAWGVSPRYKGLENGEPQRGDRRILNRRHLSPLRGFSSFGALSWGSRPRLSIFRASGACPPFCRNGDARGNAAQATTMRQCEGWHPRSGTHIDVHTLFYGDDRTGNTTRFDPDIEAIGANRDGRSEIESPP